MTASYAETSRSWQATYDSSAASNVDSSVGTATRAASGGGPRAARDRVPPHRPPARRNVGRRARSSPTVSTLVGRETRRAVALADQPVDVLLQVPDEPRVRLVVLDLPLQHGKEEPE